MRKLLLVLLLLSSTTAFGQSGMWGSRGISEKFAVRGDLVYAADGRGVSVYRVTGATSVERIDVELSDDRTLDVAAADGQLFVAATRELQRYAIGADGTLTFVDSFDEQELTSRVAADARWVATAAGSRVVVRERKGSAVEPLREIAFENPVRALALTGGILYASVDREGVYVIDPLRDTPLTSLAIRAGGFAQQGNVLWVAAGPAGITSLDVSSPGAPRILGNSGGGEVNIVDIAVAGTRAFGIEKPDKLYAFDISSPAAPRQVAALEGAYNAVAARDDLLFVAGSIVDPYGLDTATGVPLRVMNAATLAVTRDFTDLAGPVSGVATDGSLAYVVDPPFLRVLDVHRTAAPREVASLIVPRIQDRIRVRRNLAVIYGRGLVNLVDVSNPYKPRYLGTYESTGIPPSNAAIARDTIVEANYASGLHVVDTSDGANPVQIAGRIWHYIDLVASDDAIYAIEQNTLLFLDLTNRFRVVDVELRDSAGARQLELAPSNAASPRHLLLRSPQTIEVYSLAEDRFRPVRVGDVRVGEAAGLMGTTDTAGWFESAGRLFRFELVNPGDVFETPYRVTAPMQIAGAGTKLVVADRYSLRIFGPDTAPPQPPPGKKRAARK